MSCAANMRKIMWLTMSVVDNSAPSSQVARHRCENDLRRRAHDAAEFADRNIPPVASGPNAAAHARTWQRHANDRDRGRSMAISACLIVSSSARSSPPRNDVAARSRVICLIRG